MERRCRTETDGSNWRAQNKMGKEQLEMTANFSIEDMTEAIRARLMTQWEGWKNQDPAPNDAIIADDFHSTWPDGSRHVGRPTVQQMAEQPVSWYRLSELRAVPVGTDEALVTYSADIKTPGSEIEHHMAVGEAWVKRNGQWFIRAYSGTLLK
jgi:Domain of unknown function (DUF4440)